MEKLSVFCPAKLNLFLAVTGRRDDGFHTLVSVVTPLDWGDTLTVERAPGGVDTLTCDDPAVPLGEGNLVQVAAQVFRQATGWRDGVRFHLQKRVPMGAGLGGGSSDAVGALKLLNQLAGEPLDHDTMIGLAAGIGSDCPLFLHDGPVVMRGRGERIEVLPAAARARLAGRRVVMFKPAFGIETAWAYRTLAASAPDAYLAEAVAEARLADWLADAAQPAEALGYNTLEAPAFAKFVALPVMLETLRREHGLVARMSGSGSACFGWLPDGADAEAVAATVRAGWGESAWVQIASLADARTTNPD